MSIIKLAGIEYDIPILAVKQLRQISWRFIRVADAYYDRSKFTEQSMDDVFDIVYYALTAVQPDLTRAQFEALDIQLPDALRAIGTIINQTSMFKPVAEATPQTGEAPPQSTGTT